MSREPYLWKKAVRVRDGGIKVYIPKEAVESALKVASLDSSSKTLLVRVSWANSGGKGTARLILALRVGDSVVR